MKTPIPTTEPVPVQTLRRYGLHATADEVAEVYRQHQEMKLALERVRDADPQGPGMVQLLDHVDQALTLTTATQKKG